MAQLTADYGFDVSPPPATAAQLHSPQTVSTEEVLTLAAFRNYIIMIKGPFRVALYREIYIWMRKSCDQCLECDGHV